MYFARKILPLSIKIILPLVVLQASASFLAVSWMLNYLRESQLREMDHLLEGQMETLEANLKLEHHHPQFDQENEFISDLQADPNFFGGIFDSQMKVVDLSDGPRREIIESLTHLLQDSDLSHDKPWTLSWAGGNWRVVKEHIHFPGESVREDTPFLVAAINLNQSIQDLKHIEDSLLIGASALLLVICFGTIVIVSLSTKNLKRLSDSLVNIKPQSLQWQPPDRPMSREEAQLFEKLQLMFDTMRDNQQSQRLFIAHASHELKTPVAALLTSLEVLTAKLRSPEEYEKKAQAMLATVKNLHRMIAQLLDLTRLEIHEDFDKEQVELQEFLGEIIENWQTQASMRQVQLILQVKGPLTIKTSRSILKIICDNFIDNAIKYSHEHSDVTIIAEANPLQLRFIDQGIGMQTDDVNRIGEVFFRADNARSDSMSYGLGFVHASRLAKKLGARIAVESALGVGTMITLTWEKPGSSETIG